MKPDVSFAWIGVFPIADSLEFETAACFPSVGTTSYNLLTLAGGLQPDVDAGHGFTKFGDGGRDDAVHVSGLALHRLDEPEAAARRRLIEQAGELP